MKFHGKLFLTYMNLKFYLLSLMSSFVAADFVRSNGLQEGDFIVLYSDTKCGKYVRKTRTNPSYSPFPQLLLLYFSRPNVRISQMIRGVKVRNTESKPETRGPGKMQRNLSLASSSSAPDDSSPPSILQTNPA